MSHQIHKFSARVRRHVPDRIASQLELKTLLLFLAVVGGLWLFVEIADEVAEGGTRDADMLILKLMLSDEAPPTPIGPGWLENVARDCTALGSWSVLAIVTVLIAAFLFMQRKWMLASLLGVTAIGGMVITHALKLGFDRPRPDLIAHGDLVHTASFPSGHAMMAATIYLTLGGLLARSLSDRRQRMFVVAAAIALSLLIGLSRMYLGVHWPSDVLAGWTGGATWATACWLIARWFQPRPSETVSS